MSLIKDIWKVPTVIAGKRYLKPITVQIKIEDKHLLVWSPYDPQLLEEFRDFDSAKWQAEEKCWKVPLNEHNTYAINYLRGEPDEHFQDNSDNQQTMSPRRDVFRHQSEGINFILTRERCLLAFRMGLGKTLTSIEAIEYLNSTKDIRPWWLIAPKGAQKEWARQLKHWDARFVFEYTTTYESLHKVMAEATNPPQGVIFDESIKLKNPSSQRSQVAAELCRLMRETYTNPYIVLLSGSPAPKAPTDWWHQIRCLQPGFLREGNIHRFRNRLADIEYIDGPTGRYPQINGWIDDEVKALGKRLQNIVLFKDKKDCFDFPDKIREQITHEPTQEMQNVAKTLAKSAESAIKCLETLRELSDGFQYTYEFNEERGKDERTGSTWIDSPKLSTIRELLQFYSVENEGPGRLIIYAPFHATIDKLEEVVKEEGWTPLCVDGRGWRPSDALDLFNSEAVKDSDGEEVVRSANNLCFIANPACTHGISMQATHCLVYYSNNFDTDARGQSEDRRDRPGMDTDIPTRIVDLYHLPIDQLIHERLMEERAIESITLEEIKQCLEQ